MGDKYKAAERFGTLSRRSPLTDGLLPKAEGPQAGIKPGPSHNIAWMQLEDIEDDPH